MAVPQYHVIARWDDEAKVWVATSDNVPGLATEAETVELLLKKLEVLIPELLEENGEELPLFGEFPYSVELPYLAARKRGNNYGNA